MTFRLLSAIVFTFCLLTRVESATLVEALDDTNFVWVTSGDAPWTFTTNETHDGSDAAVAQLSSNQVAILETIVTGPSLITFWCKFQRTSVADFFQLKLDSEVRYTFLPRDVGWLSYTIGIPEGMHILRWQYNKWSPASPTNGAWLDKVTYTVGPLTWTGVQTAEWNTNATNWVGARNVFQNGNPAVFKSTNYNGAGTNDWEIFVGENGLPFDVAPSYFVVDGIVQFRGGDITGGALRVDRGRAAFVGYSNSLSFTGGVYMANAGLTFDTSSLPDGSTFHIGMDSIRIGGLFITRSNHGTVTLENHLKVEGNPNVGASNCIIRYTGGIDLKGWVNFTGSTSTGSLHHVDCSITIDQGDHGTRGIGYPGFNYPREPMVISGPVSDGPGSATNRLRFIPYYSTIVVAASNSYAHGTLVENLGTVVVLPNATLGTGNVESYGHLVLSSSNNISPSASLHVHYEITVTNQANIRASSIILSGTVYTNVFLSAANYPLLYGDGTIRAPGTNLSPDVTILAPTNGAAFNPGEIILFQLQTGDRDGLIQRAQFFLDGFKFQDLTNLESASSQLSANLTNKSAGWHTFHAVVTDDEGATTTTETVSVFVRTRVAMRTVSGATAIEFPAAENESYTIQVTPTLNPPSWENVATFPAEPTPRFLIFTNAAFSNVTSRFFRVISP